MGVTPAEVAKRLSVEAARQRRAAEERAGRLRERFPTARQLLSTRGVNAAWVFGSLATGSPSGTSDVDLAVEGLPTGQLFDALAELMALFETRVDLVRLEDAPESLRERVHAEGQRL